MPPTFFDLMQHVLIHLVDELATCGPVGCKWLYPLERYMGVLKGWVHNRASPEASMASAYMSEEALGFCTKYFHLYTHSNRCVWESAEDNTAVGCALEGKGRHYALSEEEAVDIHEYVLQHTIDMMPYRRYN